MTLITIARSTPGSASTAARVAPYCSAVAEAIMSTGLATLASGGSRARERLRGWRRASSAIRSPRLTQASVAMIAGPPALVTIATRSPAGSGQRSRARATSNSSSMVLARSTPHWSRKAETVTSAPAMAPVWLVAARAPSLVRPDLTIRIGFLRPTRLAISVKRRGLPNDSRYMAMTRVAGSSSQYSMQVVAGDVGLVAHRDELGEADPEVGGDVQDRHPERPRLADEPDRAGAGRGGGEGGVEADLRRRC